MSLQSDLVVWTVRGYQRMISYYTPPVCRFHPTCSQYAVGAIRVHGPVRGMALASWRILRCNPFHSGGYDPVPPSDSHALRVESPALHPQVAENTPPVESDLRSEQPDSTSGDKVG